MTNIIHPYIHTSTSWKMSPAKENTRRTHWAEAADTDRKHRAWDFLVYIEGAVADASDRWAEVSSMTCSTAGLTSSRGEGLRTRLFSIFSCHFWKSPAQLSLEEEEAQSQKTSLRLSKKTHDHQTEEGRNIYYWRTSWRFLGVAGQIWQLCTACLSAALLWAAAL